MLKVAEVPGQFVSDVNAFAVVLVNTVSVAQFVTLVQLPVTSAQYVPASLALTEPIVNVSAVAPPIALPFLEIGRAHV